MNKQHLWILMTRLPLEYQNEEVLSSIGNCIRKFLALEENLWDLVNKKLARVLVEVDLRHGLPVELEVKRGKEVLIKHLDY